MNAPVELFTGTQDVIVTNSYAKDLQIIIEQEQPLPMTILAIMPEMGTYEG